MGYQGRKNRAVMVRVCITRAEYLSFRTHHSKVSQQLKKRPHC
ncbi:hypothetical protein VCR31J2_1290136 [Vibrio coralliirubri]|uniref:Uncharacterized protein n=1 Tax=Vibrio coralliirubri TaxID=1516159 RepID=A0AA87BYG9_9VIBR|nr:hypothetical protein VCR31J2_1290136 [Vibrio coralliirubri]